jgi:hypothetical protein
MIMHLFKPGMKITQNIERHGLELYTFGLKIIFIYAEYSGPTLFASLMNLCIAKVLKAIDRIKVLYNGQGRTALFCLKLSILAKLLSGLKISLVNLWFPGDHKKESLLTDLSNIESVRLDYG